MSSVPLVYPDQYPAGAKSVSGIELDTLPTRVANAVVAFDESIIPAAQLAAQAASDPRGSAAAAEAASDPRGAAAAAQAASDPLGAAAARVNDFETQVHGVY